MPPHIIPIGPNCQVAITLRVMKCRTVSYPWDWVRDTSILDVIDIIKQKDTFDVKTWNKFSTMQYSMPHDYKDDSHNVSELLFEGGDLLSKYDRRFKRFFQHLCDGDPVYFLRYGDNENMDQLQALLPSCKIIYIPDGHPASLHTQRIIYDSIECKPDPYFCVIESIVHMVDGITPFTAAHKIIFPVKGDTVIIFSLEMIPLDMIEYLNKIFPNKDEIWDNKGQLFYYVYNKIYKLTGIEYALC
jgi:hypothetical protein